MTAEEVPDYSGYEEAPSEDKLQLLTDLATMQQDLEDRIAKEEEKLNELKSEHREISWNQIPLLMGELGIKKFTLANGFTIEVDEKLRVSVPKDEEKYAFAMAWIDDNGGSALLGRGFEITFDKSQEAFARKFKRDCEKRKIPLPMSEYLKIHSSTLTKFLTDKLAAGEEVPLKAFGAHMQKIAKITAPKRKR